MNIVNTFTNDVENLITRWKNLDNTERSQFKFYISALKVSTFMATAGFALLTLGSFFAPSIAGFVAFSLLGVLSYDLYQMASNHEQIGGGNPLASMKHIFNSLFYENPAKQQSELTKNTILIGPITTIVAALMH